MIGTGIDGPRATRERRRRLRDGGPLSEDLATSGRCWAVVESDRRHAREREEQRPHVVCRVTDCTVR